MTTAKKHTKRELIDRLNDDLAGLKVTAFYVWDDIARDKLYRLIQEIQDTLNHLESVNLNGTS